MSGGAPVIKAIPTTVYGCTFRSRTEARFATFLQHAGVPWEFEAEGYQLASGWYLPDFRIRPDWAPDQVWVEIKPPTDTFDDPRWAELSQGSGEMVLVLRGLHRRTDVCGRDHTARIWHPQGVVADVPTVWTGARFAPAWDAASAARFDNPARPGPRGRRRRS